MGDRQADVGRERRFRRSPGTTCTGTRPHTGGRPPRRRGRQKGIAHLSRPNCRSQRWPGPPHGIGARLGHRMVAAPLPNEMALTTCWVRSTKSPAEPESRKTAQSHCAARRWALKGEPAPGHQVRLPPRYTVRSPPRHQRQTPRLESRLFVRVRPASGLTSQQCMEWFSQLSLADLMERVM